MDPMNQTELATDSASKPVRNPVDLVLDDDREAVRVVTVRMPSFLHSQLSDEAHERRTSMNKLCLAKLAVGSAPEVVERFENELAERLKKKQLPEEAATS